MQNHGAFTIGPDVYQAYYRMESMELFAKISLLAYSLGNINSISEEDVRKIMQIRPSFIKDDNGYAGCRIGDRFIKGTEDKEGQSGSSGNGGNTGNGDETITLKKSELVNIVSRIVENIVNRKK